MYKNALKKILCGLLTFAMMFSVLPMVNSSIWVSANDYKLTDGTKFTYNKETGILTASFDLSGKLVYIYRNFVCFVDPAALESGDFVIGGGSDKDNHIHKKGKLSDTAKIQDFQEAGYEIYAFSFDNNYQSGSSATITKEFNTLSVSTMTWPTAHTTDEAEKTIQGNKDFLNGEKTIADLWGKKDWILLVGPNFEWDANWQTKSSGPDNVYALDCYIGKISSNIADYKVTSPVLSGASATAINYGQALADSTVTGTAKYDGKEVEGTWAFAKPATEPTVADSKKTWYEVVFTPNDSKLTPSTTLVQLQVNPLPLTISGTTVTASKIYDGNTSATVTAGTLNGIINNDDVSATATGAYANKNIGTGKNVTVSYKLSGNDAGNYTAPETNTADFTADITAKQLTVSGTTAKDKTYDGTATAEATAGTLSGVVEGENVNLAITSATFSDSNAGTNKNVTVVYQISGTDAGNYLAPVTDSTIKATINKASVTLSGISATAITYGQFLSDSTVTGTAKYDGNDVEGTWIFKNKTTKPSVSDSDKTEYDVVFTPDATKHPNLAVTEGKVKLTINKRQLTISGTTIKEKTYDGTTAATTEAVGTLGDVVSGDTVGVQVKLAAYEDKNVGTNKAVSVSYELTGEDANNYIAPVTNNSLTGNIKAKAVTVTTEDKNIKLGEEIPAFTAKVTGLLDNDKVSYSFNNVSADNQGIYTVAPSGTKDQGNYTITFEPGILSVEGKDDAGIEVDNEGLIEIHKAYQESNPNSLITVEVKTSFVDLDKSDLAKLKEAAGSKKLIPFDIKLIVKIDGVEVEDFGDINTELVSISSEFDYKNKTDIQLLRVHDGEIGELTETANNDGEVLTMDKLTGKISAKACKYSTYAFAYTDTSALNTGDSNMLVLYFFIGVLALSGICCLGLKRKHN